MFHSRQRRGQTHAPSQVVPISRESGPASGQDHQHRKSVQFPRLEPVLPLPPTPSLPPKSLIQLFGRYPHTRGSRWIYSTGVRGRQTRHTGYNKGLLQRMVFKGYKREQHRSGLHRNRRTSVPLSLSPPNKKTHRAETPRTSLFRSHSDEHGIDQQPDTC